MKFPIAYLNPPILPSRGAVEVLRLHDELDGCATVRRVKDGCEMIVRQAELDNRTPERFAKDKRKRVLADRVAFFKNAVNGSDLTILTPSKFQLKDLQQAVIDTGIGMDGLFSNLREARKLGLI